MRGPFSTRGWSVAIEAGIWLAAASLLLAQIGCVSTQAIPATPEELHLGDATFTPEFVTERRSLPAQVRYWVAPGQPFTVTWTDVRIRTDCNLCSIDTCHPRLVFPNPPSVSVRHRLPLAASTTEDIRLALLAGCPAASGTPPVFAPPETGQYLAHLFVPGVEPIPSEPGVWRSINVLPNSFTLPPRLLRPTGDAWEWIARGGTNVVKEAFDPRLRVGRVRILVGTCSAPGAEPQDDECGMDLLMDPAFTIERVIAPHYVRTPQHECRGLPGEPDGDIDLGPDPSSPGNSRCRPHNELIPVTPNYLSNETAARTPLTWSVEFSEADGFPPPDPGRQLWIEFTLVPVP